MDRTQSTQSIGSALKRVESYQYPNTHDGHLSETQANALEDFKLICQKAGYYKPGGAGTRGPTHDDETLLRYLRARKFVPEDAFKQFKNTEDWRRKNKIDELYSTIDIDEYDETRRLYPQWTGRTDKRGIPVYCFEVAPLNSKRMAAYEKSIASIQNKSKSTTTGAGANSTSPKLLRLFALYENLLRFTMPLCSAIPTRPYAETPVSQSNNIVDIAGVGLKQFWNLKQHMQDASQLATAHYPETLDRIFIIGAPSFFPTVWSWIKGWFDPITVSKIFILSKANMQSTLTQYIDPANIPRKYGGTLDWGWGDLPSLDPEVIDLLQWQNPAKGPNGQNGFPTGPIKWKRSANGDLVAHAAGTQNGQPRDDVIATLPVRDKSLNLGPTLTVEGAPSRGPTTPYTGDIPTTGTHTHPSDSQEYFPPTGITPPEEHDEASLRGALNSPQNESPVPVASTAAVDSTAAAPSQSIHAATGTVEDTTRTGTSESRYEQQEQTLAAGQLKDGTPNAVDHGYGDKTSTVETSTVGQAPKKVDIPQEEAGEESKGYVQQAKEVSGSAYAATATAVAGAGSTVLAAVGMGGGETAQKEGGDAASAGADSDLAGKTKDLSVQDGQTSTESGGDAATAEAVKEDPRVDNAKDQDVEDFIRSKYSNSGSKAKAGS